MLAASCTGVRVCNIGPCYFVTGIVTGIVTDVGRDVTADLQRLGHAVAADPASRTSRHLGA